ncbi:MAG: hypothetical protein AB8U25_00475 [Rickettsiales endosymbiont of Dermacentor nuttalli]
MYKSDVIGTTSVLSNSLINLGYKYFETIRYNFISSIDNVVSLSVGLYKKMMSYYKLERHFVMINDSGDEINQSITAPIPNILYKSDCFICRLSSKRKECYLDCYRYAGIL